MDLVSNIVSPENIPPTSKNSSHWKTWFLGSIVLVAIIIGLGVVASRNLGIDNGPSKNWTTYRDEEYGFEFKYPAQFFSYQEPQDFIFFVSIDRYESHGVKLSKKIPVENCGEQVGCKSMAPNMSIGIHTARVLYEDVLRGWRFNERPVEEVQVAGRKAFFSTISYRGGAVYTNFFISVDGGVLILDVMFMDEQRELSQEEASLYKDNSSFASVREQEEILTQILSTFTFFDTGNGLAPKIYHNAEYGFEFSYPAFLIPSSPDCWRSTDKVDTVGELCVNVIAGKLSRAVAENSDAQGGYKTQVKEMIFSGKVGYTYASGGTFGGGTTYLIPLSETAYLRVNYSATEGETGESLDVESILKSLVFLP